MTIEPIRGSVHLRAGGVAVLIDLSGPGLPVLTSWGADFGSLTSTEAAALVLAGRAPSLPNMVDEPEPLAILPEHHTGWTGRPGISGSRAGRSWSPLFTTTAMTVDGEAADPQGGLLSLEAARVAFTAVDAAAGLDLTLEVELTESGLLRSRASLRNTGEDGYQLDGLSLAFGVPAQASELLDFAGRWGKERVPQRLPFVVGAHVREGRRGRTGADAATVLHAGTAGFDFTSGEVWGVHVGWSGNHVHYAEQTFSGERVLGGGELLLPGEIVLDGQQTYTTPWLYGSYGAGLDEVARRFHRFLRARPWHPSTRRPVTINVWEAVYFDHSLPKLLDLAELAASVGVERYVLDDGWFGARRDDYAGLGDWTVSPDAWPEGLQPLISRVNELGMEFGLWFEPEMVNLDSDVARAHPEWILSTGGRLPIASRHQQVLNLGIPACYDYIRDAMVAILTEYPIAYIKWDHNRDLIDAGSSPSGRPGVHAQTEATYRLMAELKQRFPGLEIESCSSGGGRVDLGVLEHADRVWVSDCIDPLERQHMLRWTSQLIPPEMMGSHIASGRSHTTGRSHDLNFRAATAVFGHLGIEWDLTTATAAEMAELADWVAFYKEHRDLLFGGDLHRIDLPDDSLMAFGIVAPDASRALYSFADMATPDTATRGRVTLPGLAPERRYRVEPVLVGRLPSGLTPPPWWGAQRNRREELLELAQGRPPKLAVADPAGPGIELSGAALGTVGVLVAPVHPEHAVVYYCRTID